jgi:hypothetical protein
MGAGSGTACTPNDWVSDEMWEHLDRIDQEGKQPPELSGEEEAATVRYEFAYTSAIFDASRSQSDSSSWMMHSESIQTYFTSRNRAIDTTSWNVLGNFWVRIPSFRSWRVSFFVIII